MSNQKKIKVVAPPTARLSGDVDVDMMVAIVQAERLLHLPPETIAEDPSETPEMLAVQVLMQHVPAIGRMCLAGGMVSAGLAMPLAGVLDVTWTQSQRFCLARMLIKTINDEQDAAKVELGPGVASSINILKTEQASTEQA